MSSLKIQLYNFCSEYLKNKQEGIKNNITGLQETIANSTKSSAGDKYETEREMVQQEININITRSNEVHLQQLVLDKINEEQCSDIATQGSVVYTDNGNYYLAISAGKLNIDGIDYFTVSVAAPIGAKLSGLKANDTFLFNNKPYKVLEVI